MSTPGRRAPATELSDAELESQGTQAHATRNWAFLHGTAEQFARHTARMLELEQEYLRRHPRRTWQSSGGAPPDPAAEAAALRAALHAIVLQLQALATAPVHHPHPPVAAADPVLSVLAAVAAQPGGRMHKLEVHQAAREAGLDRTALATLYTGQPPLLATDHHDRMITGAGRDRLRQAGRSSGVSSGRGRWHWRYRNTPPGTPTSSG